MKTNANVYVLQGANGLIKVGHSKCVANRVREIGNIVSIAHLTEIKVQAERIERTAHRLLRLAGKGVRGEWFSATVQEAIEAIERAERIADGLELDLARLPPVRSAPKPLLLVKLSAHELKVLDRLRHRMRPPLSRADMVRKLVYDEEKQLERRK